MGVQESIKSGGAVKMSQRRTGWDSLGNVRDLLQQQKTTARCYTGKKEDTIDYKQWEVNSFNLTFIY